MPGRKRAMETEVSSHRCFVSVKSIPDRDIPCDICKTLKSPVWKYINGKWLCQECYERL
jgi:hypothetical protein